MGELDRYMDSPSLYPLVACCKMTLPFLVVAPPEVPEENVPV